MARKPADANNDDGDGEISIPYLYNPLFHSTRE